MNKVSEERMKLRIEYSRETDLIFIDNIPAYADWLENKLALHQPTVSDLVGDAVAKAGVITGISVSRYGVPPTDS